jgi:hypothetical protein
MFEPLNGPVKRIEEWRFVAKPGHGLWVMDTMGYLGHSVNYFGPDGKLTAFTQGDSNSVAEVWDMHYDSLGRIAELSPSSDPFCGAMWVESHDTSGLPLYILINPCDSLPSARLEYTWNADGKVHAYSATITGASNFHWTYTYNSHGWLIREESLDPKSIRTYHYTRSDRKGNWTERLMLIEESSAEFHVREIRYRLF